MGISVKNTTIRFPYLGFEFHPGQTFEIFGVEVSYYGVIIGFAIIVGVITACIIARKTKQNIEDYLDFTIFAIIFSVLGARLYYCIFNWEYYSASPLRIITGVSDGGLAIYGAIIAAIITLAVFAKVRKCSFWLMADTSCIGLCIGQAIGRWGNFFNREAFGGYTDSIFAMQIPMSEAHGVTRDLILNAYVYNGDSYIQVHPAFLYESIWNIVLFVVLLCVTRYKKFNGQTFLVYLFGYGLGRTWIELIRTDKLLIAGTSIPVSVMVSLLAMAVSATFFTYRMMSGKNVKADTGKKESKINIIEEIVKEDCKDLEK